MPAIARISLSALAFLCFLVSAEFQAYCQHPYDPRPPLLYGICQRPFPTILKLDYPYCRARAWLSALEMASASLPPLPASHIQSDLPPSLERLAVCALVCQPEVVTPENAPGNEVRVFLHWPQDPEQAIGSALGESQNLWLEMAIILETGLAVERLSSLWPKEASDAHKDAPELEADANLLRRLWERQPGEEQNAISTLPVLFAAIRAGKNPETAIIEPALNLLLTREVSDPANAALWRKLAACLLFNRGLALEGRPGLASTDFGAALARLGDAPAERDLQIRILLARGQLNREQRNFEAMCADYLEACSFGECQMLSLARRDGHCVEAGGQ